MHISLSFDSNEITAADRQILSSIASAAVAPELPSTAVPPQPQVGDNSGTASTGITTGTDGVSGEVAPANGAASPAPVKRGRKPKEDAAVQVGEQGPAGGSTSFENQPVGQGTSAASTATSSTGGSAAASAASTTLTLDDVRAKLQAFTAVKGIEAGIELLKTFDAGRISELPAAKYGEFVGKCSVEVAA